jgi:hypothetical protein
MKITKVLLMLILTLWGSSQGGFHFNKEKWINDTSDSLISSYRGYISDDFRFFEMIKGKKKKR